MQDSPKDQTDSGLDHTSGIPQMLMISLALLISSLQAAHGLDNGLALKPQMAYNTWNCFGGDSKHISLLAQHLPGSPGHTS